jgi:hypothetical protein
MANGDIPNDPTGFSVRLAKSDALRGSPGTDTAGRGPRRHAARRRSADLLTLTYEHVDEAKNAGMTDFPTPSDSDEG